jgi:hypothetical protein
MYAESMYAPLFSVSDQIAFLLQENALERIWFVFPLPGLLLLDELLPALLDGVVQLLSGQVRLGMCRIRWEGWTDLQRLLLVLECGGFALQARCGALLLANQQLLLHRLLQLEREREREWMCE